MTPQELKASVLQLAIQGKLVEQRPEEGTGEELFQQIQSEKNSLIKAEKIKKSKMLPVISDDEKPFDLPDGWCWVRLENLCSLITDGTHKTPSYTTDGVRFLSVKDISNGYFDLSNTKYISQAEHDVLTQRCKPEQGDVLICRIGTLGKALTVDIDLKFSIFVSLGLIKPIKKELAKYIETVINSGYGFSWIQKVKVGGGTHTFKINLDDLRLFPIPLPPLDEQKRIVARIEELLPYVERYEQAWNKLEEFNKKFPVDMQKSVLQMAIQGRLVPQLPEEGTGEELFQQIQAEKQALIRAGTIKKEKPLPEIAVEETPFDIPESWRWVRLGEIASINGGFAFKSTNYTTNGVRVIRISDFNELGFVDDKIVRHPYDESLCQYVLYEKNILLCMTGGTVGKSLFVTQVNETMVVNQRVATIKVETVLPEYVYQVILAPITQKVIQHSKNSTNDNISMNTIKDFLIPLPPLAEQKRIVQKLEEILPLCEKLK